MHSIRIVVDAAIAPTTEGIYYYCCAALLYPETSPARRLFHIQYGLCVCVGQKYEVVGMYKYTALADI